ncbi:MAG: hypothetical protein HQL44_03335 [Alphaproteobacteria bacterium]|nr:hypothetical protein [Alphaproteobacteria bacterium]
MAAKKSGLPLHLLVRKFVLVIGDEGAVLVHVVRGNVKNAWFVPIDSEEGPESIREFLMTDKRIPLLVEVDVVEQLYREEQLPKSNFLDHPKVLKRRLEMAYASEEMKAARPLNRKGQNGQKPYLFMALPMSDWLKKWTSFLDTVSNPVEAYSLLPMESLGLSEALAPPAEAQTEKHWRIFVSQEVTGGFRQIIQLNGQFILTRMTPKPAEEDTAEEISQLIEREFKSSLGYIKRLGYQENDHLDLVAVVGAPIREALYQRDLPVTTLSILTPLEAGNKLGYEKVADPDSPYCDMLHAVWLARRTKAPILLSTPAMAKKRQMRQVEKVVPLAAAAVTAFQLYYAGDMVFANYETADLIETRQASLQDRQGQLKKLEGEMAAAEVPFETLTAKLGAKQALETQVADWPQILRNVETALDGQGFVWSLGLEVEMKSGDPAKAKKPPAAAQMDGQGGVPFNLELVVMFPGATSNLADIVATVADQEKRFKQAFPRTEVEVLDMPTNIKPQGTFTSTGKHLQAGTPKIVQATFVIRRKG